MLIHKHVELLLPGTGRYNVSTGGFTKEARYEAERASTPLTLMDLDQLVEAVTEGRC
jgi:restriction system protein